MSDQDLSQLTVNDIPSPVEKDGVHVLIWTCSALGTIPRDYPNPGSAIGWKWKDWAEFAAEHNLEIGTERSHSFPVSHPQLGILGSFPKTPSDHRSYMNSMADIRRTAEARLNKLLEQVLHFRNTLEDDPERQHSLSSPFSFQGLCDYLQSDTFTEEFGESETSVSNLRKEDIDSFVIALKKIERKFGKHPRQVMKETRCVGWEYIESVVQILKCVEDKDDHYYGMMAQTMTPSSATIVETHLQELEDAKVNKRKGNKPSKSIPVQAPDKRKIMEREHEGRVEGLLNRFREYINLVEEPLLQHIRNSPTSEEVQELQEENKQLRQQVLDQAKEIAKLKKKQEAQS